MSHATLLHHFKSSDGMRRALMERMANALLEEFIGLLDAGEPDADRLGDLFTRLFTGLSDDRHGQLFAWFALSAPDRPTGLASAAHETRPLVGALLEQMSRHDDGPESRKRARRVALLVVTSAIGLGVAAPWLERVELVSARDEVGDFARWLAEFLLVSRRAGRVPH